jgi:hypothetical protein
LHRLWQWGLGDRAGAVIGGVEIFKETVFLVTVRAKHFGDFKCVHM